MRYAILNDKREVVPADDLQSWGEWFNNGANRRVDETKIGDATVSTVFLGINHGGLEGGELWLETMVFGGELDGEMWRYGSWSSAVSGHAGMVERVKKARQC